MALHDWYGLSAFAVGKRDLAGYSTADALSAEQRGDSRAASSALSYWCHVCCLEADEPFCGQCGATLKTNERRAGKPSGHNSPPLTKESRT